MSGKLHNYYRDQMNCAKVNKKMGFARYLDEMDTSLVNTGMPEADASSVNRLQENSESSTTHHNVTYDTGSDAGDACTSTGLMESMHHYCDVRTCGHSLDSLPPEVFLTICSYLPASVVLKTLVLVCRSFRDLLMDDSTWKIRISKRCMKLYPRIPVDQFDWKRACMEREDASRDWSSVETNMESYSLQKDVLAAVDAVHLMDRGQLLVSGSRDRHLTFWDLKKLSDKNPQYEDEVKLLRKNNAHLGWIWTIASREDVLATGAWDAKLKLWELGPDCREIRQIGCTSAILCMAFVGQCVVAGCYDKHTYHMDTRTGTILHRLRHHKRSVLCLAADEDYIFTGSEDNTVCVYDQRAAKVLKIITLKNFPMCMTNVQNQLLVGDKLGIVHLINSSAGNFDLVKDYDFGHSGRVTGITHGYGCTMTSSVDKTIRIMEPCDNPACIQTLRLHSQEVAGISYQNGTLVSAGSDSQIGIWRSKYSRPY